MVSHNQFRIGVVIVNYNSGDLLSLCLISLSNSHAPLDVVIVDNASNDQSLQGLEKILSNPHQLQVVKNPENIGFSRAVNQAMLKIENRYVVLLNPDCTIFPHTFLNLQKAMVTNKKIAVAGAAIFNANGSEQRGCRRNEPTLKRSAITALGLGKKYEGVDLTWQTYPAYPKAVDAVSGAAMMVRRRYFDEIGGIDESYFLHCEDLDICRKFRDIGYLVVFCPDAGVFHSQGASSGVTSRQVEKYKHDGMLIYNKKHSRNAGLEKLLAVLLVKLHYQFVCLKLALKKLPKIGLPGNPVEIEPHADVTAEFNALDIVHNTRPAVIVTGAKSDVGDFLLDLLSRNGYQCYAVSRNQAPTKSGRNVKWLQLEFFSKCATEDFGPVHAWINLAPVWTTRSLGKVFHKFNPGKIVAVSSTSIEGKYDSDNEKEIKVVNKLIEGEKWIAHYAEKFKRDCIIFRPTLVYGGPRNQNVNFLKQVIRIFRVFPLLGDGAGKRQPVHAEDIAAVCEVTLTRPNGTSAKTYNITGGEVLTYRQVLDRIFESMDLKPRYIRIPNGLIKVGIKLIGWIPGLDFVNYKMAERSEQDLLYSSDKAIAELSFNAREFEP